MPRRSNAPVTLPKKEDVARLDELCEFAPKTADRAQLVFWFIQLVAWMRRGRQRHGAKLRFLERQLAQNPEWRKNVTGAFSALVRGTDIDRLLAHGGIPRDFHFGGAVQQWLRERLLPSACATDDGAQVLCLAFNARDFEWLDAAELARTLRGLLEPDVATALPREATSALLDLAHQIVAQAHAPAIKSLMRAERSPFAGLYEAAAAFSADIDDARAADALRGRVHQCQRAVSLHRTELAANGADLNMTFQIGRVRQQLDRMLLLVRVLHRPDDRAFGDAADALVQATLRNRTGAHLVTRSTDIVVQNLVDGAAAVGHEYLSDSSWRSAFLAGAGGGALMAIATVIKFGIAHLHLPALYEGLAFSLNYASAFVAAYLLHFTIATKLPAHTASALARSVRAPGGFRERIARFHDVWRPMLRLQIAGLLGNIALAGPLALVFDVLALKVFGRHVLAAPKAAAVLAHQSLLGPSVVFAALTGVFLWISSLVGAAADNWTRVTSLTERLATNTAVMKRFDTHRARARADALVGRIGGFASNVTLGFLLGGVPAAFAIAGLPVEIRHVTVSTSSVCLAMATGVERGAAWALAIAGVVAIGLVNVIVSFALALWLALRSERGSGSYARDRAVLRIGLRRWAFGVQFGLRYPRFAPFTRQPPARPDTVR